MKKFYLFLTLMLAIVGIGVTRAIMIDQEQSFENVTLDELQAGKKVIIGCPISSYNRNPVTFANNDKFCDDGVADGKTGKIMLKQKSKGISDCTLEYAWELEDGSAAGWYYLKNVKTGRYWAFEPTIGADETFDEEGIEFYVELVEDKANANEFTFTTILDGINLINPAMDPETCSFKHVIDAAEEHECLMLLAKVTDGGQTYYYAMNDAVPGGMSNYTDWAGYMSVSNVEVTDSPYDELVLLLQTLPVNEYTIGNHPGCVAEEEAAQKYNETVAQLRDELDNEHDDAYWENALEEFNAFLESMPTFTFKPVTNGYYRITSARNDNYMFLNNNGDGGCRQAPAEPSLNDLWQVYTNANGEKCMKNLGTMKYIIPVTANSQNMKGTYEEQTVKFECRNTMTVGTSRFDRAPFNIWCGNYLHTQGTNLLTWYDAPSIGDCWMFETVTVDDLKADFGDDIMAQLKLNSEYYVLLNDAQAAINRAKNAGEERLITEAGQISSPKSQAGEGSIAALIDGDFGTYWHSEWGAGDVSADNSLHYLQFDLRQAVQLLTMKYCRRPSSNDHPTKFRISASNEADGEYTVITEFPVCTETVEVDVLDEDGEPTGEKTTETRETAGANNTLYSYALDLGAEYQYIRVLATMTDYWRGYWHASEMYFCLPGADLWTPVQAEGEALEAAIAAAKAAVAEGGVTSEVLADLKAAYEAFINAFADPTALKELIAEAKAELEGINSGINPGDKPEAAWNALKSALDAAEAWLEANMATATKANYTDQEKKLKAALDAWYAVAINAIDTEHWYHILAARKFNNHTATDYYEAGTNLYLTRFAINYGNASAELGVSNVIGAVTEDMWNGGIDYDDELAQWRFIDAGNGKYAIQNRATGLFLEPAWDGHANNISVNAGVIPGKYAVKELPGGCFEFPTTYKVNDNGKEVPTFFNIFGQGYMGFYIYGYDDNDPGSTMKVETVEEIAADHEQMIAFVNHGLAARGLVLPYAIDLKSATGDAGFYTDVVNIDTEANIVYLTQEVEAIPAGKPFLLFDEQNTVDNDIVTFVKMDGDKIDWSVDHSGYINGTLTLNGEKKPAGVLVPGESADENNEMGKIWGELSCLEAETAARPGEAWIDYKGNKEILDNGVEDADQILVLHMGNGELADAIEVVKNDQGKATNVIYNLNGQRVSAPVKGIVIMNGKKVILTK